MMKSRHLLRALVPCLLLGTAPLLSHCGGDVQLGTETGNPPVLEQMKLYLEVVEGGLRVVGTAGAIAPPGAAVRVTNLTTGASVETTAAADGSLDVVLAAEPSAELELTVTSDGQQTSQRISFGTIGARTDLSSLSCEALEATRAQTLVAAFESVNAACTDNSDCVSVYVSDESSCFASPCVEAVIARGGLADARARAERQTAAVCAALQACDRPRIVCDEQGADRIAECQEGRCVGVDPSTLTCDELLGAAEARRESLRAAADKVCSVDADCTLLNVGVRCLGDCGRPFESVALGAADALAASVRDEVDRVYCGPAVASACGEPDCGIPPEPAEAYCDAGTCAVRYLE